MRESVHGQKLLVQQRLGNNSADRVIPQRPSYASGFAVESTLAIKAMLTLPRLISFVLGCAITVAPAFLALAFAYGVGEPPETTAAFTFYLLPLIIGLIFGTGPLLIGIPKLVVGPEKPKMRVAAGAFLGVSIAGLLMVGFSGSVTRS